MRIGGAGIWHNLVLVLLCWAMVDGFGGWSGLGISSWVESATGWRDLKGEGVVVWDVEQVRKEVSKRMQ